MKKVLLLDDDEGVLDVMFEALNYEGFDVKCIERTNDIFSEIATYSPDLIILDYLLGGVNGGQICHQIKENKRTSHLPVILTSAYPKASFSLDDYGCDDFIPKPFDLDDFTERIQKLINKKRIKVLHAE